MHAMERDRRRPTPVGESTPFLEAPVVTDRTRFSSTGTLPPVAVGHGGPAPLSASDRAFGPIDAASAAGGEAETSASGELSAGPDAEQSAAGGETDATAGGEQSADTEHSASGGEAATDAADGAAVGSGEAEAATDAGETAQTSDGGAREGMAAEGSGGASGAGQARGEGRPSGARSGTSTAPGGAAVDAADITPTVTHETQDAAPGGAANTRTTVGVGEMITFESNVPGKWKSNNAAKSWPKKSEGERYMWVAMSRKGTATITFNSGIRGKKKISIKIKVIEPKVDYLNECAASFPGEAAGVAGVLMDSDITFLPDTVSFANTMWWEKGGPATGATGYFREHVTKRKHKLPYHNPNPDDLQIDSTNSGAVDSAGFWDFNPPYKAGRFDWVIPTYYKVTGESTRTKIKNVRQRCTIAADGTMTVSKGSASMSRTP
jgi:hypothetical protein